MGALALRIPEVASNPALSSPEALQELSRAIDEAAGKWVARRCRMVLEGDGQTWSESALETINKAKQDYESYVEAEDAVMAIADGNRSDRTFSRSPSPSLPENATRPHGEAGDGQDDGQGGEQRLLSPAERIERTPPATDSVPISQERTERTEQRKNMAEHVAGSIRRPLPMSPKRAPPVAANGKLRGRGQGSPIKPQSRHREERQLKLRQRAKENLPSISDILADLNGSNAYDRGARVTRGWKDGPVAR